MISVPLATTLLPLSIGNVTGRLRRSNYSLVLSIVLFVVLESLIWAGIALYHHAVSAVRILIILSALGCIAIITELESVRLRLFS